MAGRYSAFGLTITSVLPLPELNQEEQVGEAPADVVVDFGTLGGPIPTSPALREVGREADGGVYFSWAELGRIRIASDARTIVVAPLADADLSWFSLALLGPVMAMLLHMRGYLVLHGSAIRLPGDGAAMFLGDNRAGKSSLAAAFLRAGYGFVCDDIVAISPGDSRVQPAFPSMKLDRRLLDRFAPWPGERLPLVPPGAAKQRLRLHAMGSAPVPVGHIVQLERQSGDDHPPTIRPHAPAEALATLMRYSYLPKLGPDLLTGEGGSAHFRACAALAGTVRIGTLTLPDDLDRLMAAPEAIARQLA